MSHAVAARARPRPSLNPSTNRRFGRMVEVAIIRRGDGRRLTHEHRLGNDRFDFDFLVLRQIAGGFFLLDRSGPLTACAAGPSLSGSCRRGGLITHIHAVRRPDLPARNRAMRRRAPSPSRGPPITAAGRRRPTADVALMGRGIEFPRLAQGRAARGVGPLAFTLARAIRLKAR